MEGRITAIKRQKKDFARASIFLDEEFAFGVCDQWLNNRTMCCIPALTYS